MLINSQNEIRRGAEYATREEFTGASAVVDSSKKNLPYSGIPLNQVSDHEFATSADELHCFIVGETGSGKTRRIIVPSIRLLAKTGQSMVISDPKGEVYRKTASDLKAKGYDVKVINMRNPRQGDRWNPFTMIEKMYRSKDMVLRDRALLMIDDVLDMMFKANSSPKEPYWDNAAKQLIRGIMLLMLEYGQPGDLTFVNVAETKSALNSMIFKNSSKVTSFLDALGRKSQISLNLSDYVQLWKTENPITARCISSNADSVLAQYTMQDATKHLFSSTDFEMENLGRERMALYIILPDDSESMYPLATFMVKQIYSNLVYTADEIGEKLPNHVNFILDEFANFTKLNAVGSMLTASRSRGIRFILVCQNVGQLEEKYGQYEAETIRANCRVWVFMGCRNLQFLTMLQDLSGRHVERYAHGEYPLIDIDMMQHLKIGETIVWNDRCRPMFCYLPDFSSYDFGDSDLRESELPPVRVSDPDTHFEIESVMNGIVINDDDEIPF